MVIFSLLLVPLIIGVVAYRRSGGRITLTEFAVQELVLVALIVGAYYASYYGRMTDTELWNGHITVKDTELTSCHHSYDCRCHSCGEGGKRRCCSTCYRHAHDRRWYALTSNDETAFDDGGNPPDDPPPERWTQIRVGEPTAIEHHYLNYIMGNPDSVLRRRGIAARFVGQLPNYPEVYDTYRVNRLLTIGISIPNQSALNQQLSELNADLGAARQVNMTIIVVNQADPMYLEGLREHWLGGKKNDLVVVIGAPNYPEIAWSGVMSWTRNEEVKIGIRNRINDLHTFDGNAVIGIIRDEVSHRFVRRPMADFEYLTSTIEPPTWALWLTAILGILASVGLSWVFYNFDPFERGFRRMPSMSFSRRGSFSRYH